MQNEANQQNPKLNKDAFKEAAEPLIKYLLENHFDDVYATVDRGGAMLIQSLATITKN